MKSMRERKDERFDEELREHKKLKRDHERLGESLEQLRRDLAAANESKGEFHKFNHSLPPGWRLATAEEVRANKDKVARLLNHWDICLLAGGFKFDGAGYGNKILRAGPSEKIGNYIGTLAAAD